MAAAAEEAVQLLSDLVRIQSVTPWLVPGGAGEAAVAAWMAAWLRDAGVEVEVEEIEPGRVNLLATVRGPARGPTLCLNAHSDTVGYENWADTALQPRRDGDRLIGLGAADDKASCTAMMLTLRALAAGPPGRGTILGAFVADEEALSIGTERLVQRGGIDAAIVLEPFGLGEVVVAHQGFGWIDITTRGVAAHGSAPERGVDAIAEMARVVVALDDLDRTAFEPTAGSRCGKTVYHASTITGGTDYATYPTVARLGIEIGTQPGERLAARVTEIEAILAGLSSSRPAFDASIDVRLERDPFQATGHEALLSAYRASCQQVRGAAPAEVGLNAWTDAGLLQAAGIPTILAGPAGGGLHAPQEWVSVTELTDLCAILEATARTFLAGRRD